MNRYDGGFLLSGSETVEALLGCMTELEDEKLEVEMEKMQMFEESDEYTKACEEIKMIEEYVNELWSIINMIESN